MRGSKGRRSQLGGIPRGLPNRCPIFLAFLDQMISITGLMAVESTAVESLFVSCWSPGLETQQKFPFWQNSNYPTTQRTVTLGICMAVQSTETRRFQLVHFSTCTIQQAVLNFHGTTMPLNEVSMQTRTEQVQQIGILIAGTAQ